MVIQCPNAKKYGWRDRVTLAKVNKYICKASCPRCHGKSKLETCVKCGGAGLYRGNPCSDCGSTGFVPEGGLVEAQS